MLRSLLGALVMAGAILSSPGAEGASQPAPARYLWSTYLGGNADDAAWDVAHGPGGEVFLVGSVGSQTGLSLPANTIRVGAGGGRDVVVARFSAEGVAEWAVVFGGKGEDSGRAVVLGPQGELFVAGTTDSADFFVIPTDGRPGTFLNAMRDAFITRVNPDGSGLSWFAHLGGSLDEEAHDLALGSSSLLIAGETTSPDMPGGGGAAKGTDGFVTAFEPTSRDVVATELLTGSGGDVARALIVREGAVVVAGTTTSSDLEQRVNAHAGPVNGSDAFLAVLDDSPLQLLKTQYVGGQGEDVASGLDFFGEWSPPDVLLVGNTYSSNFLGLGAPKGSSDVFVARYSTGPGLEMTLMGATLLGGSQEDQGVSVAWAGASFHEDFFVGGWTASTDFPLVSALDSVLEPAGRDGFVAKLTAASLSPEARPVWSTLVGGEGSDAILAMSFSSQERLFLGGLTFSSELPGGTPGFDPTLNPRGDMLLASMDLGRGWQPSDGGTQDGGMPWDGGWDGGLPDGSWPEPKPGDGGTGPDIKDPDLGLDGGSPLGWSCGCTSFQGPGGLALGALLALGRLASRRRRADTPPERF